MHHKKMRCCALALPLSLGIMTGCRKARDSSRFEPVKMDTPGVLKACFKVGDFCLAGQPTEESFDNFQQQGYKTIINLRGEGEFKDFDEDAAASARGMKYISLPVTSATLRDALLEKFLTMVQTVEKPAVIHCATANRVSAFWAAHLVLQEGVPVDKALELAGKTGMKSEGAPERFVKDYLKRKAPGD